MAVTNFGPHKTYSAENKFRFNCPIFGAEVALRDCFQLRDEWAKGKHIPVRRGCQACLSASKCPVVPIMRKVQLTEKVICFSTEDKVSRLDPEILEQVAKVVVPQNMLDRYQPIPHAQMERIDRVQGLKGVEAMAKNVGMDAVELEAVVRGEAPKFTTPAPVRVEKPRPIPQERAREQVEAPEDTSAAAATGDMSAVINAMVKESPAPAPAPAQEPVRAPAPAPVTGAKPMSLLERARLAKEGRAA